MLDFYSRHFHTIEFNNSLYHLPSEAGLDVYCYFDNDEASFAVKNAQVLQERVGHPAEAGLS